MCARLSEVTEQSTSPEVIKDLVNSVSDDTEEIGSKLKEQVQAFIREANNRQLTMRAANGRLLLCIP